MKRGVHLRKMDDVCQRLSAIHDDRIVHRRSTNEVLIKNICMATAAIDTKWHLKALPALCGVHSCTLSRFGTAAERWRNPLMCSMDHSIVMWRYANLYLQLRIWFDPRQDW